MSVDAITASIAHEVRQPLAAIASNASAALRFCRRTPPDQEEVQAALNRIIGDCHRANELFDSIRALFRRNDQEQERLDVSEIVREALQSLRAELQEHDVTAHTEFQTGLPLVGGNKKSVAGGDRQSGA